VSGRQCFGGRCRPRLGNSRSSHNQRAWDTLRGFPRVRFLKTGAFDVQNVMTVPHSKFIRRLGVLQPTEMAAIESVVKSWLGLD